MDAQILAIRAEKLARLHTWKTFTKFSVCNHKPISLAKIMKEDSQLKLIAEVHDGAQYNGSGFEIPLDNLVHLYSTHADAITIASDDVLFTGSPEWVLTARSATKLPIVVLDLILKTRQLDYYRSVGADVVTLIVSVLTKKELVCLRGYARILNLEVIIEVQNEDELYLALEQNPEIISINSRDILNLAHVDLNRITRLASLVPSSTPVIGASGIETALDVKKVSSSCDGILIGSSLLRSRVPESSLKYFKGMNIDYPIVWVRPPAFLYRRIKTIRQEIEKAGFRLAHTSVCNATQQVYRKMYMNLFRSMPQEGVIYYNLLAEMLRQVDLRGGNSVYSEIWFFDHDHNSLTDAYNLLNEIKQTMRQKEKVPIISVSLKGKNMPVMAHSIHVPDPNFFAHMRDMQILTETKPEEISIGEYMEQQQYKKSAWYPSAEE